MLNNCACNATLHVDKSHNRTGPIMALDVDEKTCVYQATIVLEYNSTLRFCFLFFFCHSSCRKDQFNVLRLKFGTIALD